MSRQKGKDGPRLADVAEQAGVSLSTASMALSAKGRLSDEIRSRVRRVASEIGYAPPERRRIKTSCSGVLILLDRKWAYAWGMNQAILESLEITLATAGRTTTLIPVYEQEPPEQVWKKIQSVGVDSVFSIHYGSSELFTKLETAGIPVVVIMNNNYQTVFNSVCVDDYQGAYEAGKILLSHGHRRLAYLSADLPLLTAVRTDRLIGFRKALEEHGIGLPDRMQPVCDIGCLDKMEYGVDDLFELPEPPTALFVMDDYIGVRVYGALERRGVRVPEDLSLICAGDVLDYNEPFLPQLSTMSIQFSSMGRAAGELMLSQIGRSPEELQHEVLKVKQHFVDRGTVATVAPPQT